MTRETGISKEGRFGMRADPEFLGLIDNWRRKQTTIPSRSEAIRILVRLALADQEAARSV